MSYVVLNYLVVFMFGTGAGAIVAATVYRRKVKEALHEGARVATDEAVRRAVVEERMAVARRLHDAGRRYPPRPDATGTAKVHRAQVGLPRPGRPRK